MTREELEYTNELYDGAIDDWKFFVRSYMGKSVV